MKLPAGTYFIGDPCYVIADEDWSRFCDEVFFEDSGKFRGGEVFDGQKLFQHGTAHGDGCYRDQKRHQYGVDAGVIGATPKSLWGKRTAKEIRRLGRIYTFAKPFECDCENGLFWIGEFEIDTN